MKIISKNINNVPIKIIQTNKFKSVNIELYFTRKLDYKDVAPYNLLVNMLVSKNEKYPSISSFSSYKEENYGLSVTGGFSTRANMSVVNFRVNSINSRFSLGEDLLTKQIETLKDCLYLPLLNENSLSEIKDIYVNRLKDKLNKKTYILKKKINDILGTNTPYGVNAESNVEDIQNVTLDDIKRVYDKLFNSNIYVYVVGDVNEDELVNKFSFLTVTSNSDELDYSYIKEIEKKDYVFESRFLQSAISLIYECDVRVNDELFYPLRVFIEMLNYELFNIIREKYNYCYYIYALKNNYLNTIEIVSEIDSKNFEDVIRITNEIIDSYKEDKEEIFISTKNKILNALNVNFDNARDLSVIHFGFDFNRNVDSLEELVNAYKNVSYNQIKEVSGKLKLKMTSILKEDNHE